MVRRFARFMASRLGRKIMTGVGIIAATGLMALVVFYAERQQESILAQQERTLVKVTDSIIKGLKTVMLAGYGDIGHAFFDRLRGVGEAMEIRLLRPDGSEAFRDNATIRSVNARLGEGRFRPRASESRVAVLPSDAASLRRVLDSRAAVSSAADSTFTLLVPVTNETDCHGCHGAAEPIRAVIQVTTALGAIQADIRRTWQYAIVVLGVALAGVLICLDQLIRRTVVRPVNAITAAMQRAERGDLSQEVPVLSHDELGQMAHSFNRMIRELLGMYSGLNQERNKLSTVLLGAMEGIVVTDRDGQVVLVNAAAQELLGKSEADIVAAGFAALLDDAAWMAERIARPAGDQGASEVYPYRGRILSVQVARIADDQAGRPLGSAALLRDVTDETNLRDELQRLSDTDALTGLHNRRYYDDRIRDELALARRYPHSLALFVLDVDHFKKFNDTYGHDQGDRVLQAMGRAMRDCAAKTHILCRYGGEEFVCILPGAGRAAALEAAERLRAHVAALAVDGLKVTISIGVAVFPDLPARTADALLKAADTALYAAKQSGRNRVCLAETEPATV